MPNAPTNPAPQEFKSTGKTAIEAAEKLAAQSANAAEIFSSYLSTANETLTSTASELYKCQRDIADSLTKTWRLGAEQRPAANGIVGFTQQMRDQSESVLSNLRRMNDVFRDCGWKFTALFVNSIERASGQISSLIPKAPAE